MNLIRSDRSLSQDNDRRGIALVVTLGFLGLLIIVAVGFAVMMRTERFAARNYADIVKARQLLRAALARAMNDINTSMTVPTVSYYPPWTSVKESKVSIGGVVWANQDILGGEAGIYLPTPLSNDAASVANTIQWIDLKANDPVLGTDMLVGRYCYLIVNCSGLIDANYIGSAPRRYGSTPTEMVVTGVLSEIRTNLNFASFVTERNTTWKRFESVPDIWSCGSRPAGIWGTNTFPSNLFSYSRAPAGFLTAASTASPPAYIGSDVTLWKDADIEGRFIDMSMSAAQAANLRLNLQDYVDADDRPNSLSTFCTEATPLINEIVISNQLAAGGGSLTNTCWPTVEVWYPFSGYTNKRSYNLVMMMKFTGAAPAEYNPSNRPSLGQYQWAGPLSVPGPGWTQDTFKVVAMPPAIAVGTNPLTSFATFGATITNLYISEGVVIVDQITNLTVDLSLVPVAPGTSVGGAAINDPRFNYDPTQWKPVGGASAGFVGAPTLLASNLPVMVCVGGNRDGNTMMYVRNGAMTNTGELGFLAYDPAKPWQTIRLLDPDSLPVLSYFTIFTNESRKGLINPNAFERNVLAAAFYHAPTNRYMNEYTIANNMGISNSEARALADRIVAKGPYKNAAEIAKLTEGDIELAMPGKLDSWQKESLIRSAGDLLSTRHNAFTIILVAQSATDQNGNNSAEDIEITGEQRAVSVVWRDPFPVNGRNEMYVRFLKWLTD